MKHEPTHFIAKPARAPKRSEPRYNTSEDREACARNRELKLARIKPNRDGIVIDAESITGEKVTLAHVPGTNDQLDIDGKLFRCTNVRWRIASGKPTVVEVRLAKVSGFPPLN